MPSIPPPALLSIDAIRAHERRAFRTWPAATVEEHGGWVLRFNQGVTHRANSVFTADFAEGSDVDGAIVAAEAFFAAHGQPPRFMISPASRPDDLDARLEARGYVVEEPSLVRVAEARSIRALAPTDARVDVAKQPDTAWNRTFMTEYADTAEGAGRLRVVARIEPPAGFAVARVYGHVAAIGMGIVEDGWMTVLGMYTPAPWRGGGYGGAVLRALAAWAEGMGAANLFLQVTAFNAPAIRLYDKAGFRTVYGYHYRLAPEGGDVSKANR
jgi:N-acetylglutamate synthase